MNKDVDITDEEIISRIPDIISKAYNYGYWAIDKPIDKTREGKEATESYEIRKNFSLDVEAYKKDLKVLEYLFKEGFIIYRLDIKQNDLHFVQLTDMGRELKEKGSLKTYKFRKKYWLTKASWEFIKAIVAVSIGAILTALLQPSPITKVSVETPKVELYILHDTIRTCGSKATPKH